MLPLEIATLKPFIKWAGGKRQLLSQIEVRIPWEKLRSGVMDYAEPFVGGGAVLFHVLARCPGCPAIVNDLNPRLIEAYRALQERTDALIAELARLEQTFLPLDEAARLSFYLQARKRFNSEEPSPVEHAALLIFLNRTCFNGLYRENSAGNFNVPYGKVANPTICDVETLRADGEALRPVTLLCGDFEHVLDHVRRPTFFYLDPPYKPISNTSSFNAYTKVAFDDHEQERLADFCRMLNTQGHTFLLSNSDPGNGYFERLYEGFRIERVQARRSVNANPAKRGPLAELLISNLSTTEACHG